MPDDGRVHRPDWLAGEKFRLNILTAGLGPENATTECDVDRMEVLSAELRKFDEDVKAGQK